MSEDGYTVEPFDPSEEGLVPDEEHELRDTHDELEDDQ